MSERIENPIGYLFEANYNPQIQEVLDVGREACWRYNQLSPVDREGQRKILSSLLGTMGEDVTITPPFYCDYGYNISIGDHFYSNHNLIITDGAPVTFGDHVFIAPNCCITTANHAIDPELRKAGYEVALPVKIGSNVWIGAGSTILAGVQIGDNTVIGAGSVVTRDIPSGVVAVGVPCKVMRNITQADQTAFPLWNKTKERRE